MSVAVLVFPGSNCDHDAYHAIQHVLGHPARFVWHKETDLGDATLVVLPGGFSHGDYLRTGAIARFSPIMEAVTEHARAGGVVIGICNGFQILCEAGMLPGALVRNTGLRFRSHAVHLRVERAEPPFASEYRVGQVLRIPIAHGEGCYFADESTLETLRANHQILWQYCDARGELTDAANPNGSLLNIAGVCNERRNVAGLMPHPERASEAMLGGTDGRLIFESLIAALRETPQPVTA